MVDKLAAFAAAGCDATVYVTDTATPDVKTADKLGSRSDSGTSETVTGEKPLSGRYVLVWLTGVPKIPTGSYQGALWMAASMMALGMVLLGLLDRQQRRLAAERAAV